LKESIYPGSSLKFPKKIQEFLGTVREENNMTRLSLLHFAKWRNLLILSKQEESGSKVLYKTSEAETRI
jgi:hypothetical protein